MKRDVSAGAVKLRQKVEELRGVTNKERADKVIVREGKVKQARQFDVESRREKEQDDRGE